MQRLGQSRCGLRSMRQLSAVPFAPVLPMISDPARPSTPSAIRPPTLQAASWRWTGVTARRWGRWPAAPSSCTLSWQRAWGPTAATAEWRRTASLLSRAARQVGCMHAACIAKACRVNAPTAVCCRTAQPLARLSAAAAGRGGGARLPSLPAWVQRENVRQATIIGTEETTAQVAGTGGVSQFKCS